MNGNSLITWDLSVPNPGEQSIYSGVDTRGSSGSTSLMTLALTTPNTTPNTTPYTTPTKQTDRSINHSPSNITSHNGTARSLESLSPWSKKYVLTLGKAQIYY